MNLIIVESPTKAKTLSRFLGKGYRFEATMGHIRDLPKDRLGVNIDKNFEPDYIVPKEKKKIVEKLKKIVRELELKEIEGLKSTRKYNDRYKLLYGKIILATDLDREGEAIAWHVAELLTATGPAARHLHGALPANKLGSPPMESSGGRHPSLLRRIVFHEITRQAVEEALKHPREIDMNLVNAQQGRRVLDRLVGYKLSPLLWYKTGKNWLSAGRVQSVAVRLIVEREREIEAFKPQEYWKINVKLKVKNEKLQLKIKKEEKEFLAELIRIEDKKAEIKNKEQADQVVGFLEKAFYKVQSVKKDIRKNYPPAPFITSTLQRAGANLFGWPARKTMIIAQNLYEQGAITYHRTDSVQLSKESLVMVRDYINNVYGKEYLPPVPRIYKTKSKLAQEAHEAIRPTSWEIPNSKFQIPNKSQISKSKIPNELGRDHQKLLDLISKRFIACQMREEEVETTKASIEALVKFQIPNLKFQINSKFQISNFKNMFLEARGERQVFTGWRRIYVQSSKLKAQSSKQIQSSKSKIQNNGTTCLAGRRVEQWNNEKVLPSLSEGEVLDLVRVLPEQKFTQPPARYNEASLIKALEEKGIGRPSTYAPIISTIQARQYVDKEERAFKPTELGLAVNDFLVANFAETINVEFTAKMEDQLDEIAKGELKWVRVVGEFWEPFEKKLSKVKSQKSKVKIELKKVNEKCPKDGGQLVVRIGKYGKFLACLNFPKCRFTKPLVEKTGIKCPKCRGEVVLKKSKKGRRFYGCSNYPECNFASWRKP